MNRSSQKMFRHSSSENKDGQQDGKRKHVSSKSHVAFKTMGLGRHSSWTVVLVVMAASLFSTLIPPTCKLTMPIISVDSTFFKDSI